MKKTYCTPELNVSHLEPRDVLCTSYIIYDIVESRERNNQGETPPVYMGGTQS